MPKSILFPTAVVAALLLLGSGCAADSDSAGKTAGNGESSSAASATPGRDDADAGKAGKKDDAGKAADAGKQAAKRDAAKDKASRDKDADESAETDDETPAPDAAPEDAPAGEGGSDSPDAEEPEINRGSTGTLTVAGGPFRSLSFPTVQCSADGSDLYLQSRSDNPAAVLTVLFSGGAAAHASLQTAPVSGEGTTWSDDDAETVSTSVRREDDTVTLTKAVLKPLGDDSELTVTGSLTCNEKL